MGLMPFLSPNRQCLTLIYILSESKQICCITINWTWAAQSVECILQSAVVPHCLYLHLLQQHTYGICFITPYTTVITASAAIRYRVDHIVINIFTNLLALKYLKTNETDLQMCSWNDTRRRQETKRKTTEDSAYDIHRKSTRLWTNMEKCKENS